MCVYMHMYMYVCLSNPQADLFRVGTSAQFMSEETPLVFS